jgi:hypothetical protein
VIGQAASKSREYSTIFLTTAETAAVSKVRCGERKRLRDVVGRQLRIVPEQIFPVWVQSNRFHHSPHGQAHAANTWLPVHLVRIPGNPGELLHCSHFHALRNVVGQKLDWFRDLKMRRCRPIPLNIYFLFSTAT